MSFKVEVLGKGETKWVANALRFRTQKEAKAYQGNLYSRWMGMEAGRVKRSTDPVNYAADQYGRPTPIGEHRTRPSRNRINRRRLGPQVHL